MKFTRPHSKLNFLFTFFAFMSLLSFSVAVFSVFDLSGLQANILVNNRAEHFPQLEFSNHLKLTSKNTFYAPAGAESHPMAEFIAFSENEDIALTQLTVCTDQPDLANNFRLMLDDQDLEQDQISLTAGERKIIQVIGDLAPEIASGTAIKVGLCEGISLNNQKLDAYSNQTFWGQGVRIYGGK